MNINYRYIYFIYIILMMLIVKFGKNRVIIAIALISLLSLISLTLAGYEYEYHIREPPYENQNTDPPDGTEREMYSWWDPEDPSYFRVFIDADKVSGIAKLEAYEIGNDFPPVYAWAEFNTNPPPGNSPIVVGEKEGEMFRCTAEFYIHGCLIGPKPDAQSVLLLIIYVYERGPYYLGWRHVATYYGRLTSWDHGGEQSLWIIVMTDWDYLAPNVEYSMATGVKVGAFCTVSSVENICAWADFRSSGYCTWTADMCIVALRWRP